MTSNDQDFLTLGIETSCDETSVAVLRGERELLSHLVLSQLEHERYGGVVPELASRAHQRALLPMLEQALAEAHCRPEQLDLIGVTLGPGLLGSLLVGISSAKALSFSLGKPLVGVNHIEAHLMANLLLEESLQPPFVALLVSGGHTMLVEVAEWGRYLILGRTRDDAVGESFDKVAKLLGLGYPGGPAIEREAARGGNPKAFAFPRPMLRSPDLDLSFSGLKTAVLYEVEALKAGGEFGPEVVPDLAASFQAAVVEVLVEKSLRACAEVGSRTLVAAGGVARNRLLRDRFAERQARLGLRVVFPPLAMCTDNAAMVARTALYHYRLGRVDDLEMRAFPTGQLKWPVRGAVR